MMLQGDFDDALADLDSFLLHFLLSLLRIFYQGVLDLVRLKTNRGISVMRRNILFLNI